MDDFLDSNKSSAMETLVNESVYFESYFKEGVDGQTILYLFMFCKDLQRANEIALKSDNPVDKKHFEFMKQCIDVSTAKLLNSCVVLNNTGIE